MTTAELTLYRCYWPAAHGFLKASGASYQSQAFDVLMTLELSCEHACALMEHLPAGAVIGATPILTHLAQPQENDEGLSYASPFFSGFGKN